VEEERREEVEGRAEQRAEGGGEERWWRVEGAEKRGGWRWGGRWRGGRERRSPPIWELVFPICSWIMLVLLMERGGGREEEGEEEGERRGREE
jgi:hypothetical protein